MYKLLTYINNIQANMILKFARFLQCTRLNNLSLLPMSKISIRTYIAYVYRATVYLYNALTKILHSLNHFKYFQSSILYSSHVNYMLLMCLTPLRGLSTISGSRQIATYLPPNSEICPLEGKAQFTLLEAFLCRIYSNN